VTTTPPVLSKRNVVLDTTTTIAAAHDPDTQQQAGAVRQVLPARGSGRTRTRTLDERRETATVLRALASAGEQ
jgi:hypothetical protein